MFNSFGHLYLLIPTLIFITLIIISLSKLGKVKIGGKNAETEFSRKAWYAMLFSAGMGTGLIFTAYFGTLTHAFTAPIYNNLEPINRGLGITYYNWGIQAWALYALFGLGLGFYAYNKKLPMASRSLFYPIIKDKIYGISGDIIDSLTLMAALIGLSTSLTRGAQQINSGLFYLFGTPISLTVQSLIILFITFIATFSVITGIKKGVKILSQINISFAFILFLIIFFTGSTIAIIFNIFTSTLLYTRDFLYIGNYMLIVDKSWANAWSVFYYAWWIAWAPFVGMFIAKISKGRTVREYTFAVILLPTIVTIIWFATFGTVGLEVNELSNGNLFNDVSNNISASMFLLFNNMGGIFDINAINIGISLLVLILVITFLVTSSDSASLVVDGLASGGSDNAPIGQRVFWALLEGAISISILLIGGEAIISLLESSLMLFSFPLLIIITIVLITIPFQIRKEYMDDNY